MLKQIIPVPCGQHHPAIYGLGQLLQLNPETQHTHDT